MYNNQYYYPVNPYYPQQQRLNQLEQQYPQYANSNNFMPNMQPNMQSNMTNNVQNQMPVQPPPTNMLQGKVVDSIEVAKAIDTPLDGSITYFPKTDGTAIYAKQLKEDGKSKWTIYEAVSDDGIAHQEPKFAGVQKEDIEKIYNDISDVKKSLVEAMDDLFDRFDEFRDEIAYKLKEDKKPTTATRGGKK